MPACAGSGGACPSASASAPHPPSGSRVSISPLSRVRGRLGLRELCVLEGRGESPDGRGCFSLPRALAVMLLRAAAVAAARPALSRSLRRRFLTVRKMTMAPEIARTGRVGCVSTDWH